MVKDKKTKTKKSEKAEKKIKIISKEKKIKKAKEEKVAVKETIKQGSVVESEVKPEKYYEGIGRRKTAIARVRIYSQGGKGMLINDKPYEVYFPVPEAQQTATSTLRKLKYWDVFRAVIKVKGGGYNAQAEAIRLGTARALVKFDSGLRRKLSKAGLLTRDPRMRERKKFGLKRARRAPQWQKR